MSGIETQLGNWIERTLRLYLQHMAILIPAGLIGLILSVGSFGILAGPMGAGMILIVFRLLDGREPQPVPTDIFRGFELFLPTFLYTHIWGGLLMLALYILYQTFIGRVLGIVLFLATQVVWVFGFFLLVDRRMDFKSALLESFRRVLPLFFPLLAVVLVAGILAGAGFLVCVVGAAVTLPLGCILLAMAYRAGLRSPEAPFQRPGPENG